MSSEHSGIPTAARFYASSYIRVTLSFAIFTAFSASFGALIIAFTIPEALSFYAIGAGSFVLHSAALHVQDAWTAEHEPGQTEFTSRSQMLARLGVVGIVQYSLLFIGTGLAVAATSLGGSFILAAALVAYYPVIDLLLARAGHWTPGNVVVYLTTAFLVAIMSLPKRSFNNLPVVGGRQPPQA
jgi:hypothetical protein